MFPYMYIWVHMVSGYASADIRLRKGKSVDGDSADEQETDSEPGLVEAGGFSICRITPELQAEKAGHSRLCDA